MSPTIQSIISIERLYEEGPNNTIYLASIKTFLRRVTRRLEKAFPGVKVLVRYGYIDGIRTINLPGVTFYDIENILNEEVYSKAWVVFAYEGYKTVFLNDKHLFTLPAQPLEKAIAACRKSWSYMQKRNFCIPDKYGKINSVTVEVEEEHFLSGLSPESRAQLDLRASFQAYLQELERILRHVLPGTDIEVIESCRTSVSFDPGASYGSMVILDVWDAVAESNRWRIRKGDTDPIDQS